ncbi:MAG: ROK family protein [Janthinobacterium lividum]
MMTMDSSEDIQITGETSTRTIGVVVADYLYAGDLVDGVLAGPLQRFPEAETGRDSEDSSFIEFHTDALVDAICQLILRVAGDSPDDVDAVGLTLPGLIRHGVVEEAPNLPQLKGARLGELLCQKLAAHGMHAPVVVSNDADATAAGLAATHGSLDRRIRVWTLGTGIGFGSYPQSEGTWEGGHTVVTLDERENYCGCGGRGHLEGIMGHRAMRLRFLDMEPEEVFAAACRKDHPDQRCCEFRNLWHRALAAATASSIHIGGAGKFFFTGYNVHFLDLNLLREYLHDMVKMSPLQSYQLEIVDDHQKFRVIGAAITADQVTARC